MKDLLSVYCRIVGANLRYFLRIDLKIRISLNIWTCFSCGFGFGDHNFILSAYARILSHLV
jgi:hypothetical protein